MSAPAPDEGRPGPIAPAWHTLLVLAMLVANAWLTVYLRIASANARLPHVPLYVLIIVLEWVGLAVTLWRSSPTFVASVARVVREPRSLGWDMLTAVAIMVALAGVTFFVVDLFGLAGWPSLSGMVPRTRLEAALWILASISAGVCEEAVFRGYLQQQISAWTRSVTVGIVGQAVIFGLCHAYQGYRRVVLICVWGLVFGIAAWVRRGLRGNMIAHAVVDALAILSAR